MLYYTDKDPLNENNLTEYQITNEVFNKLIRIVPRIGANETANSIIALRILSGSTDSQNHEFLNLRLCIEVFVPMTQWIIKNQNLRPFCIMGQIMSSLNNKTINGLGRLCCNSFELSFLTDEMSCYEMTFNILEYE